MTAPPLPMNPYQPRTTRSVGVVERAGWRLKLIGIAADGKPLGGAELNAAGDVAERVLPQPPKTDTRPGIGFVIAHRGTEALWVLVGWWELDIMYERLWRAELGTIDLRPVPPGGPTACVWELRAIDHERRAWVEHVLTRPADPDFTSYLTAEVRIDGPAAS